MRKNCKRSRKMSVLAESSMRIGVVIVTIGVMSIVSMQLNSTCDQLLKGIGEKERQLGRLEEERVRQSARWEEMKTPDRLEQNLARHGLAMYYPKADQIVRMKSDGRPYPGQLAVAKARQRNGLSAAMYQMDNCPVSSVPARNKRRSQYRKAR